MVFVVETQGLENYGAHQGTGKFRDGEYYWKFKSGTTYLVHNLDRLQDAVAFVAALCMENGIGWKEYPAEAMTLTEWENQFDGDLEYKEFKLKYAKRVQPDVEAV